MIRFVDSDRSDLALTQTAETHSVSVQLTGNYYQRVGFSSRYKTKLQLPFAAKLIIRCIPDIIRVCRRGLTIILLPVAVAIIISCHCVPSLSYFKVQLCRILILQNREFCGIESVRNIFTAVGGNTVYKNVRVLIPHLKRNVF